MHAHILLAPAHMHTCTHARERTHRHTRRPVRLQPFFVRGGFEPEGFEPRCCGPTRFAMARPPITPKEGGMVEFYDRLICRIEPCASLGGISATPQAIK